MTDTVNNPDILPPTQQHGAPNTEPCRTCGAPLTRDQRYCLNCGTRRAEARIPFLEVLSPGGVPSNQPAALPAGTVVATQPSMLERIGGPAAAAAIVLVAIGIGVLIGNSGGSDQPKTVYQRSPVINLAGAGAGAPAATTPGAVAPVATTPLPTTSTPTDTSTTPTDTTASTTTSSTTTAATTPTSTESTAAAQQKLKNAPKTDVTSGKTLTNDNKAPGGGSSAESIG